MTITIMYSCRGCATLKRNVVIPARDPDVDILAYMDGVVRPHVSGDHAVVSPHCPANAFDLYLPAPPDADYIGQPTKQ